MVLDRRLHKTVTDNEMQFAFMSNGGIFDAVFILRKLQEEYHATGKKLYMCFVDLDKALDSAKQSV